MCARGKKFIVLFLIFYLGALSGNLTAQTKKGTNLIVELNDGQEVSGELITVKKDSLLLLDSETNADTTVLIKDVKMIKVQNKSKMLELGILGGLGGAAVQGLTGKTDRKETGTVAADDDLTTHGRQSYVLYGAIAGGVGVLLGAVMGIDKTIQIQGRSDTDIQKDLEKLSKKARVAGIQ